jgi:hypothetical protein
MQERFSDTDIREALRRHYAALPSLSDDFNDKLFAALNRKKRQRKMRRLIIWPSIAAAATVALLLTLLPASEPQHNAVIAQMQPEAVNQSPVAAHPDDSAEPAPVAVPHEAGKSDNDAHVMDIPVESKNIVNNKVNQQGNNGSSSLQGGELPAVAESPEGDESPTVDLQETNSGTLSDNTQLLLASNSNGDHATEELEEEIPVYSEADLPITNMENYLYSKDELKKIEQLRKERLIADIKSTVERARYRLEEIEKSFAQN